MARKCLILILSLLTLAACTAPAGLPTTEPASAPTAPPAAEDESADTPAGDASAAGGEFAVTPLSFEGNGDTLLEHIAEVARGAEAVVSHRYVEQIDAAGMVWQGEEITTADAVVVVLQPVGSGGGIGVELQGPAGADWRPALDGVALTMGEEVQRPEPEIRNVAVRQTGEGLWSFDVTLAYPDTGWEDYADGWHIATPDGEILATRILLHPHVNEQPFTRGQGNVAVPDGVDTVIVRAHTLVRGYSDATVDVSLAE